MMQLVIGVLLTKTLIAVRGLTIQQCAVDSYCLEDILQVTDQLDPMSCAKECFLENPLTKYFDVAISGACYCGVDCSEYVPLQGTDGYSINGVIFSLPNNH
jgi:hypothetical protein